MGIYWKNIDPEMQILGATQQFIFNQNLNQFQFDNTFVPTSLIPSQNLFELRNSGLSGFRFRHETAFGDTHGTLKIQSLVNGQTTGVDLMSFNQDGTITFNAPLILNDLNFTKIGIGIDPTVDGTIQFSNDLIQKKLVLYDTTGNNHQYYGFGIDSGTLRYQSSGGSHLFWIGTSSTTSYCGLSINSSGNIGLGNYQSATLSRLFINGGPTLDAVGEESAIRVQNSDLLSTTIKIQLHHQNAKNWELRSNSNGSFEIYDRFGLTSRFLMQGTGATTLNGSLNVISDLSSNGNLNINGTGSIIGNLGVGTTPTLAKLQIVGGVQNIVGEDTAIRVSSALNNIKIELQNTAIGGKLFEIRSSSTGQFDITDRTGSATRFTISSAGNIGINMGLSTPNAPLQLSNGVANRKIVLFELANNDHQFIGLGFNANSFRFQVPTTSDSWNFLAGLSSASSQTAAQITGTGNIVIPGTYFGRRPSGMVYMEGNVATTALTANVWAKIAGTTTASGFLNQFTSPVSNRLTYTGTTQVIALVNASATLNFSAGGGVTVRSISIFKNGIQITPSLMSENLASGANINMSTQTFVSLTTNDYIEVYCRSSSNSNVTASNLILTTTAS